MEMMEMAFLLFKSSFISDLKSCPMYRHLYADAWREGIEWGVEACTDVPLLLLGSQVGLGTTLLMVTITLGNGYSL